MRRSQVALPEGLRRRPIVRVVHCTSNEEQTSAMSALDMVVGTGTRPLVVPAS